MDTKRKRGRPKGSKGKKNILLLGKDVGNNDPVIRTAMMKWIGMKPSDIADIEGISVSQVFVRVREAIARGFVAPMQLALGQSRVYEILNDSIGELDYLTHVRQRICDRLGKEAGEKFIDEDPKLQRAMLDTAKVVTDLTLAFFQRRKIAMDTAQAAQEPSIDTPIEDVKARVARLQDWIVKCEKQEIEALPASFEVLEEKSDDSGVRGGVGGSRPSRAATNNNHTDNPIPAKTAYKPAKMADNTNIINNSLETKDNPKKE